MGRIALQVDKQTIIDAIASVESSGPMGSEFDLFQKVAEFYNKSKPNGFVDISHSVAMLRIRAWELDYKTKPARNRKVTIASEKIHNVINEKPVAREFIGGLQKVTIPAGLPLVTIQNNDKEYLKEWAQEINEAGRKHGLYYMPEALAYWVMYYCPSYKNISVSSEKLAEIKNLFEESLS